MPIVPVFDPTTGASGGAAGGGGGSAYDVTPPAATTQAKASGASLTAHTFGAFTGPDAGSIDGYTARTVNAVGSTSWAGSGLGAWTPSSDADGDAGVLALDATIGGTVVATALHDYSRAAAGGGAGLTWSGVQTVDLSDGNVTAGSKAGTGAFTIFASDGTTARVAGTAFSTGSATGSVSWDANGVRVQVTSGSAAYYARFVVPLASVADEDMPFHADAVLGSITVPSGDIALLWLGNATSPSSGTSVGTDLFNDGGPYKLRVRRTVGGTASFGLEDTLGGAPVSIATRLESRGGDSVFDFFENGRTDYLADNVSAGTAGVSGGCGSGSVRVVGGATLWNGTAYFALGGTNGIDVTLAKFRYRELS